MSHISPSECGQRSLSFLKAGAEAQPFASHRCYPRVQAGNPCLHSSVAALRMSYGKQMWQLGYAVRSAKSLLFEQYDSLLLGLHHESEKQLQDLSSIAGVTSYRFAAAKDLLLSLRDQAALSLC